jgi:predicted transcriptional regulator
MTGLISVAPKWADMLVDGRKTIELRRSPIRLAPGSVLAVYATNPLKMVLGTVVVSTVEAYPTEDALSDPYLADGACVTAAEARAYLAGAREAVAVYVRGAVRWPLDRQVSLRELREVDPSFAPPQVWRRLSPTLCARLGLPS